MGLPSTLILVVNSSSEILGVDEGPVGSYTMSPGVCWGSIWRFVGSYKLQVPFISRVISYRYSYPTYDPLLITTHEHPSRGLCRASQDRA